MTYPQSETFPAVVRPRFERGGLILVGAVACVAYAWGIGDPLLEPYYAAGVRSMAVSWRNFACGAFDPAGFITLDKLPGAFWPQALLVRFLGPRPWALVLPQVVEGVLTVVVLHRAVRRLFGAPAGLIAALVLAVSPVNVALNRGNVPDTLLTLLLVLAADSASVAIVTGRTRSLVMAGVWVGLAFQTKMVQAWFVLPALGLAFTAAGPGTPRRRVGQLARMGGVTLLVSLVWMIGMTLAPASSRPYVDGSTHNSVFEQVFVYNGLRRASGWSPLSDLAQLGLGGGMFESPPAGWSRLLVGTFGRSVGWLLPGALLTLVAGIASRRAFPRADTCRAGFLLWGTWLVTFGAAFSVTSTGWPYYSAVLTPAVAAVLGGGGAVLLRGSDDLDLGRLAGIAVFVIVTAAHVLWLLPREGVGVTPWLRPLLVATAVVALLLVAAGALHRGLRTPFALAGLTFASISALVVPVAASASIVAHRMGPFDVAFQSLSVTTSNRAAMTRVPDLGRLARREDRSKYLLAAHPAGLASRFVFYGGDLVVPIGGLTGNLPEPSLAKLRAMVRSSEVHLVLAAPSADARYAWIASRCAFVRRLRRVEVYRCRPADADRDAVGRGRDDDAPP